MPVQNTAIAAIEAQAARLGLGRPGQRGGQRQRERRAELAAGGVGQRRHAPR
jgi:hypothetical protein